MTDALPPEMHRHYDLGEEQGRLFSPHGALERLRTQDVLARRLPPGDLRILDVGGAAGVHAIWLAERGHAVHLIDPVPLHVEQAAAALAGRGTAAVGDARALDVPDGEADAVLLLGPLYHLTDRADRLRALREAWRATKPGGTLVAAGISRYASLLDGLARDLLAAPAFEAIVRQDLVDGQHRNPGDTPGWFTTTFFHHPDELRAEVVEAGWAVEALIGVEGPAWVAPRMAGYLADDARRAQVLDLLAAVETEPSLVGASAHMLVVARK